MSKFNKSYRIRTEVGKDTQLHINLDRDYDTLEIMSLKINQENAYKLHTSNYGVIAGRVLANEAFGIPNAKISVFINIDDDDINDVVKSVLYPYNTTSSKDSNGVKYNLLPDEKVNNCHTTVGTFPEKQYMLDNDNILEIFDKYYKFTARTNNSGDYMIFGVPTGSQTIHVDIDLSDIGILSQKPRDMVYKGYNIEQFENANKFKYDTNLENLTQLISQDTIADVIPFWGDEDEGTIGITRCDINIQYKFEPTCVFMGSVVTDTASNGFSQKCIPTPGMGSMEDITTGSGTIEMIRKTPSGDVEEFQIKGTQLIDGDGVWCYQIPMNLDYVMTDEFGKMVPTNNPDKGIPTRTKVRFRISMEDFENDNSNIFRCKMLVPHNPDIYSDNCENELDYQFGTNTKEESYRDLFWNGVYTVKSYIPRIQKGSNWKNEKFTGFKRVNYHGDKTPIPYNNIRINIPFAYVMICTLIKTMVRMSSFLNWVFKLCGGSLVSISDDNGNRVSGSYLSFSGDICTDNLDYLCIIPGVNVEKIARENKTKKATLLGMALVKHYESLGGTIDLESLTDDTKTTTDSKSIYDNNTKDESEVRYTIVSQNTKKKDDPKATLKMYGIRVTDSFDYFIQCIEMKLAQEFKVIQFDFYNDWINGMIYIPRWVRNIKKKKKHLWNGTKYDSKVIACNDNFKSSNINIVQQCSLSYKLNSNSTAVNPIGCHKTKINGKEKLRCHKEPSVRKAFRIFRQNGIVHTVQTMKSQYVYYFKPYEYSNNKNIRLYATDIVLLGTLNDCDIWGIPGELKELVSTSYQMPSNLALTDSDLEGIDYGAKKDMNAYIEMTITTNKTICNDIKLNSCYTNVNPMEEEANYTEIAGVSWDYNGPLQTNKDGTAIESNFYKPGGHFLGLSCKNSETNVKTCVNLTRICEHGVWMSQRQTLNIPSNTTPESYSEAFPVKYATVPSGVIAKDEISDTNYRRLFASMNKNKLKTKINKKTGYPVYDFEYVNPTNFNGELSEYVNNESNIFNRKVDVLESEKYYNYIDSDYYERELDREVKIANEIQIMRTGEYFDKEYYKFRFGFNDTTVANTREKLKRFLIQGKQKNSDNTTTDIVSFPMYDNSFYFYFGLHDGRTAIDEFKRTYYAVCEENNDLIQIDKSVRLTEIKTTYDGVCENNPQGTIEFYVNTKEEYLKDGLTITLKQNDVIVENTMPFIVYSSDEKVEFKNLAHGTYTIEVHSKLHLIDELYTVDIKQIKLNSIVKSANFTKDVKDVIDTSVFGYNRNEFGGYISFNENLLTYDNNDETIDSDIFGSSTYVSKIIISSTDEDGKYYEYSNDINSPTTFKYKETSVSIHKNNLGEYMIPVPFADKDYTVIIETKMIDCKPTDEEISISGDNVHRWVVGDTYISNSIPLEFIYNGVTYDSDLFTDKWWVFKDDASKKNDYWLSNENEVLRWKLKEALYMNIDKDMANPHKVPIMVYGGAPYYTDKITGMTEENLTKISTELTRSDLNTITIPTINYGIKQDNGNITKRANFTYQVHDVNNQIAPFDKDSNKPMTFTFPVIYKPFFMEMIGFYFNENDKCFLFGNIYNGKTWDYKNEGFNDVRLNGLTLTNFATIDKDDPTMELDEFDYINTTKWENNKFTTIKGGYDCVELKEYSKYNGRKVNVNREIEPVTYGLFYGEPIPNFRLEVGCSHYNDGITYSDSTSIQSNDMQFFKFKLVTKMGSELKGADENKLYVKMYVDTSSSSDEYKLYHIVVPYIVDGVGFATLDGYDYPYKNNKVYISNNLNLFNNIVKDTLKSTNVNNIANNAFNTFENEDGYIDVSAFDSKHDIKMYYIAVSNNTVNNRYTSNPESKIKAVSVSNIIKLSSLSKFYPFDIQASITDTLESTGRIKTLLTVKPKIKDASQTAYNTKVLENFKNKRVILTFYEGKTDDRNDLYTYTKSSTGNAGESGFTVDITSKRDELGISYDENSQNGSTKYISFDYEVYSGKEKAPTTFLNNKALVTFVNKKNP